MFRKSRLLLPFFLGCAAWAQNTVVVANAMSTAFNSNATASVAPGSLVQVEETAQANDVLLLDPANCALQLVPAGSQAPLPMTIFPGPHTFLLAMAPSNAPLGPAQIHLLVNGVDQGAAAVNVVASNFGLYTAGPVAVADSVQPGGSIGTNSLTRPARPGDYVTVWGTGLGTIPQSGVTAKLGGRPVMVTYAGHSSEPGVDQINIQIPDDPQIPAGCYVALEVDGPAAAPGFAGPGNRTSISFARGKAAGCRHPLGLNYSQLQKLDSGGGIPVATIDLSQSDGPAGGRLGAIWNQFVRSDDATWSPCRMTRSSWLKCPDRRWWREDMLSDAPTVPEERSSVRFSIPWAN